MKIEDLQKQIYLLELKCQRLDIIKDDLENGRSILRAKEKEDITVFFFGARRGT